MMTIAAFDIYEIGDDVHRILDIEPTDPVNDNFNQLGLESQYFINNMGTMLIWPFLMIFALLLFSLLNECNKVCKSERIDRMANQVLRSLKYNAFITVIKESFAMVMLCSLINLSIISFSSVGLTV